VCQKCIDAVRRYLPKVLARDRAELLWGATCYPAGDPEQVEKQVRELAEKTRGTLCACLAFADERLTQAMAEYNASQAQAAPP